jgi:transposase
LKKRLRRGQLADYFANLPPCTIGLEATHGAHHWARVLETFGHTVRLVAPQFVKPYLQSQKNDPNDAAAICEAVSRPQMRFVPRKTVEQQDMQALHRVRSRLIGSRTQIGNQIRGLLAEYGIVLPQHISQVSKAMPAGSAHSGDGKGDQPSVRAKRTLSANRGSPRTLFVHGSRSVVFRASKKEDARSKWIAEKQRKLGTAKACVAVANKNARIIWVLLAHNEPYRRAA